MFLVRTLLSVACAVAACAGLPLYDTAYPMYNVSQGVPVEAYPIYNVSQGVPVDGAGALFPHYYKDGLVAPYACDTFAWRADNMAFVIKFGYVRALSWAVLPELNITRCYLWVDIDEAHTKSNHGMVGDQASRTPLPSGRPTCRGRARAPSRMRRSTSTQTFSRSGATASPFGATTAT